MLENKGGKITPKSFDIDTAKRMVGDARMRVLEAKAKQDADNGVIDAPTVIEGTYIDRVYSQMDWVVYSTAHSKRLERIKRMKERGSK